MRVGNQEQICVKLDHTTVTMLTIMAANTGLKKNRVINNAIRSFFMSQSWR